MLGTRVVRAIKEYDPNQPRVTSGPKGGQWVKVDNSARMAEFPVSPALAGVAQKMAAAGFKIFVVGGAVRDFLLGKPPHDFDLATDARPEQTKSVFAGKVKFDAGGEAHGVIRVEHGGEIYEITTLRVDEETDGKHAQVRYTTSIVDDLQRRDLTVNALAYDLATGTLYGPGPNGDPSGALADLKNRQVRFVGDGRRRITEDLSRALRLFRFAVKLKGTVDETSFQAVRRAVASGQIPDGGRLPAEEVRNELLKTLALSNGADGLRLWRDSGLLFAYIPELIPAENQSQNKHHGDVKVLDHILRTVGKARFTGGDQSAFVELGRQLELSPEEAGTAMLRLTMLMHDVGKPRTAKEKPDTPGEYSFIGHEHVGAEMAREIGRRLKLPKRVIDVIADSVDEHMAVPHPGATETHIRRWARGVGEKFKPLGPGFNPVEWLLAVREADWGSLGRESEGVDIGADAIRAAIAAGTPLNAKPPVSGERVMRMTGLKPGRQVGDIVRGVGAYLDANPAADEGALEAEIMRLYRGG